MRKLFETRSSFHINKGANRCMGFFGGGINILTYWLRFRCDSESDDRLLSDFMKCGTNYLRRHELLNPPSGSLRLLTYCRRRHGGLRWTY